MMTKDELAALAAENKIAVDGRWGEDRLVEELTKAGVQIPGAESAAQLTPVRALKDLWLTEDDRIKAGLIRHVPVPQAKAWIAAKAAERADPFPGEG